ncbi:TAP-like protein-domain-containing protein [Auriculariales sp. MPI-PUGE-AT-0066]|nr:TAP-like protein-domain-containing protein [Auriculariales sp. MPI-PUGE-AT-0066]
MSKKLSTFRKTVLLLLFVYTTTSLGSATVGSKFLNPRQSPESETTPFNVNWDEINPSEKLEWHPCGEPLLCARLAVPLDYTKPDASDRAAIALVRYPSKYQTDDPKWRGPVLYNPGGPGHSGVFFIGALGGLFSNLIGSEFDHIGFDPRGVGYSTPKLGVFADGSPEEMLWKIQRPNTVNSLDDSLIRSFNHYKILGELAVKRVNETARLVSTAFVARDMLRITEAFGREKLQFYGFSYGTQLGVTFASMFPDKVERIILDGVVDAEDYIAGAWKNNIVAADQTLKLVYDACATSAECPLHEDSSEKIAARVNAITEKLNQYPLLAMDDSGKQYGQVDGTFVRSLLLALLYGPYQFTAPYLQAIADAEVGNASSLLNAFYGEVMSPSQYTCPVGNGVKTPPEPVEALPAIACGDAYPVQEDIEGLRKWFEELTHISSMADTFWIHVACAGWRLEAAESYRGPFTGNTSHPLLFIGNTLDPVTSLVAAKKMAKGYEGAVTLTQNSGGHASIAAQSQCTHKYIREYFINGTLPSADTVCEIESEIFPAEEQKPRGMKFALKPPMM